MSDTNKPPTLFWVIAGLATAWNLLGFAMFWYVRSMTPQKAAEDYGQAFADIFATKPTWATGAFFVSVFAGLLGSIGLLLRKSWATSLFIISLIGILVHNFWGISAGTWGVIGTFDKVMTFAVMAIAIFLIWFARKKNAKGYLN